MGFRRGRTPCPQASIPVRSLPKVERTYELLNLKREGRQHVLFKQITKVGAALTIALTIPAMAADSEDANVIALGYANAAYWQAKTCKLDKLSLELNQTCPLQAVATPM